MINKKRLKQVAKLCTIKDCREFAAILINGDVSKNNKKEYFKKIKKQIYLKTYTNKYDAENNAELFANLSIYALTFREEDWADTLFNTYSSFSCAWSERALQRFKLKNIVYKYFGVGENVREKSFIKKLTDCANE